jgi:hypothetical protein
MDQIKGRLHACCPLDPAATPADTAAATLLPAANFFEWDPMSPTSEHALQIRTTPLSSGSPMADAPGLSKADRVVQRYKQAIRSRDMRLAELQARLQVSCCCLVAMLLAFTCAILVSAPARLCAADRRPAATVAHINHVYAAACTC